MKGKEEFSDFIKYINNEKIPLDENIIISLKKLITVWRNIEDSENVNLIYQTEYSNYDDVTEFVKKTNNLDLSKLWCSHVVSIVSTSLYYEFKLKFTEKYEKLFQQEKDMLSYYRKILVTAILSNNDSYVNKSLIDKLLLNSSSSSSSGSSLYNKIQCENIEIRPSKLHKNGVFASADIDIGTIVTFYPVDGYKTNLANYNLAEDWIHIQKDNFNMEDYECVVNENLKIVANPNKTSNKMLLGHMINDSVGNTFKSDGMTITDIQNGIYEYYMRCDNNCKLKINEKYGIIYVITTKNIKKDDELTFSYTPLYWFTRTNCDIKYFYDVCSDYNVSEFIKTYLEN